MANVLMVGLAPDAIDYSDPFFAGTGLDAAKVRAGIAAAQAAVEALGCTVSACALDGGDGSAATLREALAEHAPDIVLLGAGLRLYPKMTALFEGLVNTVHAHAPAALFCFNAGLPDTAAAVRRLLPA